LIKGKMLQAAGFLRWKQEVLQLESLEKKEAILKQSILQRQAIVFLQRLKANSKSKREERDLNEIAYG